MLWKCCTQYSSKFGKLSSDHRTGKGQFLFLFFFFTPGYCYHLSKFHICALVYCIGVFLFLNFLTLQYCIGFAVYQHESTTGTHMFLILNPPPSSLPVPYLWVVPVHQPQASSIVHRTWHFILNKGKRNGELKKQTLWNQKSVVWVLCCMALTKSSTYSGLHFPFS